nr:protein peste-like isoform X2 [Leptinotarsa decemlineata]
MLSDSPTWNFSCASYHQRQKQQKMKSRRRQCGQICLLLTGIFFIGTGVTIFIFFEALYEFLLKEVLKIAPDSIVFNNWRTNDPPLIMDIYIFNWTNAHQVKNHSVKPEFQEIGPYRFKEVKDKVNITWHNNHTISYMHDHKYFFDAEHSVRNLSDVITTLNAVPLTIAYKARHLGLFAKMPISIALSTTSSIYVKKTAGELLFEGYRDPILSTLYRLPFVQVQDKFGYFYGKNGTIGEDGVYSMSYRNDENFGKIVSWKYRNRTDFFQGECNDIRGSAGEFFPFDRQRDRLELYNSQLCKYAILEYVEDVSVDGIHAYKYTGDNMFDNGTTRPENACYCVGECIPSGAFNVSSCRDGSPTFLSLPHFYNADPSYTQNMKGMKPEKSKHSFFFEVEPKTGLILNVQAGMQVNMLLQPIPKIRMYDNVPKMFVPLFYFSQNMKLAEYARSQIRMLQNLPEYSNYLFYVLLSLGSILILWAVCSCICCSRSTDKFELNGKMIKNSLHEEVPLKEQTSQRKYTFHKVKK